VLVRESLMRQVIANLVSNAIEALDQSLVEPFYRDCA
jgi:hypothetical protein